MPKHAGKKDFLKGSKRKLKGGIKWEIIPVITGAVRQYTNGLHEGHTVQTECICMHC